MHVININTNKNLPKFVLFFNILTTSVPGTKNKRIYLLDDIIGVLFIFACSMLLNFSYFLLIFSPKPLLFWFYTYLVKVNSVY